MKFIKFTMSDKSVWSFPEDEAKAILMDPKQLFPIKEPDGKWHGRTINKAHIVDTDFDHEAQRKWQEEQKERTIKLDVPRKLTEEQRKSNIAKLKKMREELIRKKIITK
jgi:hypothetical protein